MEMDKELEKQAIESYLYCNKFFPRIWGKPNKKEHKLNTMKMHRSTRLFALDFLNLGIYKLGNNLSLEYWVYLRSDRTTGRAFALHASIW